MTTLLDHCSLIRSKNAGPFTLTFDLMCKDQANYDTVVGSGVLHAELIAGIYGCEPDEVTLVNHPGALAVKISMPRPRVQGDLHDSDCYAGQQYAPLVDLQITADEPAPPRPLVTLSNLPAGHPGRDLLLGRTPSFACRYDQRFSYVVYVPTTYDHDGPAHRLLVAVHGTERSAEELRSALVEHAEEHAVVVLAPLFPAGIGDPNDVDNYKFIQYGDIRFDEVLLAMVEEVGVRWNVDTDRFALHGFSGGGQFAHRFLYLHPERLSAASVGSPGRVTLPDTGTTWRRGIADVDQVLGRPVDLTAVAAVPVQVVVGELDDDTGMWKVVDPTGDGRSRLDRARTLAEALAGLGGDVRLDVIPGVAHEHRGVLPQVVAFLESAHGSGARERCATPTSVDNRER